ncbi:ribosome maturation factor RimP [Aerococcus tenax]|uniref:ribosome maturation factor RimP n=1 Tax=Aerococcus tenax TaxID=3078812 RepID=UPI0018A71C95|nr:ribosome maturation factor RimP [Aerococcus tenax]
MAKVTDQVKALIEADINEMGYQLFDITFSKEGKDWYLRIYIDNNDGITIADCVKASEKISEILDNVEDDPIPQAYYLEVSSPGAERPLNNDNAIQQAIGKWVHLNFYHEIDGSKFVEGRLLEASEQYFTLKVKDKTRRLVQDFPRKSVSLIRLAIEF